MKGSDSSKSPGPARTRGMREIRPESWHLNRQLLLPVEQFIYSETISGALLLVCAIVALDLQHWINDGLMAIFLFVVALEIKRELVFGDLSDTRKAALPVAAAVGGMILPAGLYLALNFGGKGAAGWRHIACAGLIGGVGFTVSLFITGLAFSETLLIEEAKVGVLAASLIAALGGYLFLLLVSRGSKPSEEKGSGA